MNQILIVIPFYTEDAPKAELLCDWIYALNNRKAGGHVLLVSSAHVHPEMIAKIEVSASMAFESVAIYKATPSVDAGQSKQERINRMFSETAKYISTHYTWPWFWLEPDCVPLISTWRSKLAREYSEQPKRYSGGHLKFKSADKEALCLSRISVYPANAHVDLSNVCASNLPFNIAAGESLIGKSSKSRLVQHSTYKHDTVLREDAVLLHSDKTGALIDKLKSNIASCQDVEPTEFVEIANNGRKKRLHRLAVPMKFDMRTRAGRAAKTAAILEAREKMKEA